MEELASNCKAFNFDCVIIIDLLPNSFNLNMRMESKYTLQTVLPLKKNLLSKHTINNNVM